MLIVSKIESRIQDLLVRMKAMNEGDPDHGEQYLNPPEVNDGRIATLKPGISRHLSPMLAARFNFVSRWENARLGQNWFSLDEISGLLSNKEIVERIDLRLENDSHFPPASVAFEDCVLFGYVPYALDETYLVWKDGDVEPVVWEYFEGDYLLFNNFERYLQYIVGDREDDDAVREVWDGKPFEIPGVMKLVKTKPDEH